MCVLCIYIYNNIYIRCVYIYIIGVYIKVQAKPADCRVMFWWFHGVCSMFQRPFLKSISTKTIHYKKSGRAKGAEAWMIRMDSLFSWCSFSWRWHLPDRPLKKKFNAVVIWTCCISAQHRPNNSLLRSDFGSVVCPSSATNAPTQDQVAHVKPNLCPSVHKLCHIGPQLGSSWAQVGAKWPEFGAS